MSEHTDDDRLKDCPFCGGNAEFEELEDEANFGGLVVTCLNCLACSRVQFGEDRANLLLEAWNRRKGEEVSALEARVRELEAEKDKLLEALENALYQSCAYDDKADSNALSAYGNGLRILSDYNRFDIEFEYGRRVIGTFKAGRVE